MIFHLLFVDDKLLKDYDIQDGARLTLVVKKSSRDSPSPVTTGHPVPAPLPPVWEKLQTFLRRHFTEKDAELVLAEFRKVRNTWWLLPVNDGDSW